MNGRSGPRVGTMQFHGGGRRVPLPDRLRRLPDVRGDVGPAVPARDRPGRSSISAPSPSPSARTRRATSGRSGASRSTSSTYLAAPFVVEPFRAPDCTVEVDGACAVVVSALDAARDLPHPPAVVAVGRLPGRTPPRARHRRSPALGRLHPQLHSHLRDELFGRAGVGPGDVQVAEIYDCFTSTVLMGLEGLGLCERGGAGAFVRSGATALDGAAAGQHPRRAARRGLPPRDEHRRRGRAPGAGPRAATARCPATRWPWSPPAR